MSNTGDLPKYVQISELLAIPELCMFAEGARCREDISAIEPGLACAARGDAGRPSLDRGHRSGRATERRYRSGRDDFGPALMPL